MRRCAFILGINKITVARRLRFFGIEARKAHQRLLKTYPYVTHLQFDDLITSEHTKCKPLSVSLAVDGDKRTILSAKVSSIAAFGHLAKIAQKKYGFRKSTHLRGLHELFEEIKPVIAPEGLIKSDEHKAYPYFVRTYFPKATYQRFKGGRGAIVGQGELKKLRRDPLFTLNHTCAMLRADISRLILKTCNTTKDPNRLQDHIDLYIQFYNQRILKLAY